MLNPPSLEPFFQQLTEANRQWLQNWVEKTSPNAESPLKGSELHETLHGVLQDHGLWLAQHSEHYQQQLALWLGFIGAKEKVCIVEPEKNDRRFNAPEWQEPLFDFIKQNYLLISRWLMEIVHTAPAEVVAKDKVAYFTQQFIDALSPANFALTNPEVMKLALETRGESLSSGMKKLLEDLQRGTITMTDESQFEVGRNLAITPGQVIFENELFQLIQYSPQTEKVYAVPLLVVPPCVNKYYIMDMRPENSMMNYIVSQGHTVFLVSWKSVSAETSKLTWDDYVERGVILAAEIVRKVRRVEKMNVLSFCIGGELVATALPVMQARSLDWFASLTHMTVMLDHSEVGDIKYFIDESLVIQREALMQHGGVVSGKDLARVFAALRSNDLIWNYVVNNYLKGKTPPPFDLLYWNNDPTNLALPMHTFFLRNMYIENNLVKSGAFKVCGEPVDLNQATLPIYVMAAREDHIVPWRSVYKTTGIFKGERRFVLSASGHVAGAINPVSANKRNYWTNEKLGSDPDAWLAEAESHPGSWWQDWMQWLTARAGKEVAAPKKHGNATFKPLEPAPGRYVQERII